MSDETKWPTDDDVRRTLKRASETQAYRFVDLPGFHEWSQQYADADPAAIAYFDAVTVELTPDELNENHTEFFEESLRDLRTELDEVRERSQRSSPAPRKSPWWKRILG